MLNDRVIFAAFAAIASLVSAPAAAQDPDFARMVEQANAAAPAPAVSEIAPLALAAVQDIHRQSGICVPTAVRVEAPRPITATRHVVQMIGAGEVRNGWVAYGRLEGCEERRPLLLVVFRPSTGPLIVAPLMFGEAIANPTLILDARGPALTAVQAMARQLVPGCADDGAALTGFRLVSTAPDLGPDYYGVRYRGSWREAWTFAACGRRIEMPITFAADGQSGASYTIHAGEARVLD